MTREFSVSARRVQRSSTASSASKHTTSAFVHARPDPTADLAARQAGLVAALVAGGPDPAGFDPDRLAVVRRALLRKRAGEVAAVWPLLAASLGTDWPATFADFAAGRAPAGALRDGWDLARALHRRGRLDDAAAVELAGREVVLRYRDGRRRRLPAARRCAGGIVVQCGGRMHHLGVR
jgi:hypothetical protein